jgi:chemosensory pili system protein ChpA (sensor histidine kinase/response regulator)
VTTPFALVIEDHLTTAEFFAAALNEGGFETEIIRSGQGAIDRLSEIVPDMIILDLNLPRVSGAKILKAVRSDERLADTRVIVATTHWQEAEEVEQEADLVILKPVGFEQLRDLASRFLPKDAGT